MRVSALLGLLVLLPLDAAVAQGGQPKSGYAAPMMDTLRFPAVQVGSTGSDSTFDIVGIVGEAHFGPRSFQLAGHGPMVFTTSCNKVQIHQRCPVRVSFRPTGAGVHVATLSITALGHKPDHVVLIGEACDNKPAPGAMHC